MTIKNEKNSPTYPLEIVEKSALEYFNNDKLAADVWVNKYCLKDSKGNLFEKNPDDMHRRIAKELFRIESKYPNPISEEKIYESLRKFKRIVPQGSPMSGIGNNFQIVSLSNCFVIGNDADSYGGILKVDEEQVQLMKRRGGVGHDLSKVRPKTTAVNNSALTSTGIVPFMERYSNSTKEAAQAGRRGALMLSISIKHPDAEDFIDAKMEKNKVTGANVSVRIDDKFMSAVINNEPYIQYYPTDWESFDRDELTTGFFAELEEGNIEFDKLYTLAEGYYAKVIDANKLWKKIIHNAWKSAEPGILFWDNIINESIPSCYGNEWKERSTNPCFSGNEKLMTTQGYKTFEELCGNNVEIFNKNGDIVTTKVWNSGIKKTIKFINTLKEETVCTPEHVWMLNDGSECNANDLKGKRLMPFLNTNIDYDKQYVKLGFIQGDGTLSRLKSNTHKGFEINIGKNDDDVLNYFGFIREYDNHRTFYTDEFHTICSKLEFSSETLPNRNLPSTIWNWDDNQTISFLRGLFSANGCVIKGYRVSFKTTCKSLINDLTKLLNKFDIDTYYTTNKAKNVEFNNGEYFCKESYDLNIARYNDLLKFHNLIGFIHEYKMKDLSKLIIDKSPKILKVEDYDEIDVYDFNEPITNWGVVNGYIAHNCGELPLPAFDSCRLLALNLYGYVMNPFTDNAEFNWDLFKNDVVLAQRYMDDIVDLEIEKIDAILYKLNSDPEDDEVKSREISLWKNIRKMAETGRRTGLGITAEGDMLAALGFTYGTKLATDFSEMVHKILKKKAYESSMIMAKERGAFPLFDAEKEKNNPFLLRIKDDDDLLYNDLVKYGRRNIALLTIAPTGSVSICTQTTSGIESVFLPVYKRRRKINPQEKDVKIDYIDDEGIAWQEYPVLHHNFKTWLKVNNYDIDVIETMTIPQIDEIVKKSPYYKATSNDVDWVEKVEMQGRIQKHVDHSISVTVNLPADATEETVAKVYETGWRSGCKGITVYRDGSRSGVLITDEEKKKKERLAIFNDNHAPKRPKRLKGDIIRFQNNLEKWIAVVGLLDGRPYELFVGRLENGLRDLPTSITQCEVVKTIIEDENGDKKKRYDIEYIDTNGEKQIHSGLNHTFNPEYWNYAKLISSVLRHGMPLSYVYELVRSLNLNDEHLNTWKAGIERVIKKYIKDGEKAKGKCLNCGSEQLEFLEGCLICKSCGSSKCG